MCLLSSFARALLRSDDLVDERQHVRNGWSNVDRQMIAVLKMTPPMLLLVGVRFEDESLLYFASTLEAEEA